MGFQPFQSFNDMCKTGYFQYMCEAEGHDNLVNTTRAKFNAVRREIYHGNQNLGDLLKKHNLSLDMLSWDEKEELLEATKMWYMR